MLQRGRALSSAEANVVCRPHLHIGAFNFSFDDFFRTATGNLQLYDYQRRLMRLGATAGSPTWTARVLSLRDAADLGLFRLAWLETFLRAADAVGSAQPTSAAQP